MPVRLLNALLVEMLSVAVCGCRVTQEAIERRHYELNGSIRRTSSEQLLLNIVRLL